VCLRLLTDRARSRAELAEKLAAKGFAPAVAERTLDRLAEVGLIDDAAFAEQWVHSRHAYSGKGKKVLVQELRRKGIAPEDSEPALEAISADDEQARAADLVRQKLRTLPADLERDKAIRRLVGMLARRGYDPSTAYMVVTVELATADFPDPPRREDLDSESRGLQRRRPQQPSRPESSLSEPRRNDETLSKAYPLQPRRSERSVRPEPAVSRSPSREEPYPILRVVSADMATATANTDIDDVAIALLRRKLQTMPRELDRDKVIRRLVGLLARRGYNQSQAYTIVKAELAARD
jgi:SOS response regulatory protein OraA/RecX